MQHNYTCKSESFVLFDIFLSWRNEKNHNRQKKRFFGFLFTPAVIDSWKLHGTMEPTPRLSMKTLVHGMWISLLTGHDTSRSGEVGSTWVNTPLSEKLQSTFPYQNDTSAFLVLKQYHLESTGTHLALKTSLKIKLGNLQCCDQWISI